MRSVSEQSLRELGGRWSVLTRQKHDHMELGRLLGELERTSGSEPRRVPWAVAGGAAALVGAKLVRGVRALRAGRP